MKIRHAGLSLIGCLLLCAQAVKRPSVGTPFTAPAGDHYRTVLSLLETHSALSSEERNEIHELLTGVSAQTVSDVRHFDRYLRSFAAALVSLSEKAGGPHLQSALTKIMGVIEKTLKPGILDQHVAAQKAITRADEGVQECYNALWRGLNASNAVRDSLVNKSKAIKSCYRFAAAASDNVSAALISLPRLLTARSADCEKLLAASDVSQAPLQDWATRCDHHDSPSVGTYLMKQLMHWEELLQQYDDIEKRCKESTASYETQVTRYNSMKSHQQDGRDCTSLQDDMDAAACKQALDRIDSCGTYGSCIKDSISDRASLHASQCKIEVSLKAQWFALESIKCFLEAYKDHEGSEDLSSRFATCKSRSPESYKLDFLVLRGCHSVEANLADALNSTLPTSRSSRECAVTKDPKSDPSLAGTSAYEATYYVGFKPTRCTAKCCSEPPYLTSTSTSTTTTTLTTTTTSTTTTTGKAACNATTVNMELSKKESKCTKLADGSERWLAGLSPALGTPQEDLKEFGLALASRSAKLSRNLKMMSPETETPHVVMDENKKLAVYVKHPGSCSEQQAVLQRVLPAGRSLKMHRCKGSDDYFV